MSTASEIGGAFGFSIPIEVVFLPITYYAMRKKFNLRSEGKIWQPFLIGLFTLSILNYFGIRTNTTSVANMVWFAVFPIIINAIVLKLTYSGAEIIKSAETNGNGGNTDLMRYASEGDIENAKKVIQNGVDINARNEQGATALLIAILNKHPLMVSLLLENGADVTINSNKGLTPISLAEKMKQAEIVKLINTAKIKQY